MLTCDDVMTSSGAYPDRPKLYPPTDEMLKDAATVALRVSSLLVHFGQSRKITSGYRPGVINAETKGAAKKSNHLLCRAADISDKDGTLKAFCLADLPLLESIGLWMEDGKDTPSWCHLQIVPPGSGNRVFKA